MSHILIADDDKFLTSVVATAFEKAGFETMSAHDGHEAVKLLAEEKPDLALLDLHLPGIDGIGVLKFIRSKTELEGLPVFIVSNSTYFSGGVQSAWSGGATKFIRKSEFSPQGLVEEVSKTVPPPQPARNPSPKSPESDQANRGEDQNPPTTKSSKSALITDDDRTIHSVLSYFLRQAGFEVESAFNGLQALEMGRRNAPGLLILDVNMPVKGGFETLAEWTTDPELRDIPVIMLTSSTDEENESKFIGQGATHYLTKPFSPESLVDLAQQTVGTEG